MNSKQKLVGSFILLNIFISCSGQQLNIPEFEVPIRECLKNKDAKWRLVYVNYQDTIWSTAFTQSELELTNLSLWDSIYPKTHGDMIVTASNTSEPSQIEKSSVINQHKTQESRSLRLVIDEQFFDVTLDLQSGKLRKLSFNTQSIQGKSYTSFVYNYTGELLYFMSRHESRDSSRQWRWQGTEDYRRTYYFLPSPFGEVEVNVNDQDKAELKVVGDQLKTIINKLILSYLIHKKSVIPRIPDNDSSFIKFLDSCLSELKVNQYLRPRVTWSDAQDSCRLIVNLDISPTGKITRVSGTSWYWKDGKWEKALSDILVIQMRKAILKNFRMNPPKYHGIPSYAEMKFTVDLAQGRVSKMYAPN